MTEIYKVTGMTCNGCRLSVEKALQALPQVESVSVSLEQKQATIISPTKIPTEILQFVLPDKYTITAIETRNDVSVEVALEISKFKQLQPLFIILGLITITTIALNFNEFKILAMMRTFMGLFFVFFSLFKFLDLKGFATSFAMYDPLANVLSVYATIYPFIELILGILFLSNLFILESTILTIIILSITTIGVVRSLLGKEQIQCACLGTVLKLPMTLATFIENAIMILMGVIMLTKMMVL